MKASNPTLSQVSGLLFRGSRLYSIAIWASRVGSVSSVLNGEYTPTQHNIIMYILSTTSQRKMMIFTDDPELSDTDWLVCFEA